MAYKFRNDGPWGPGIGHNLDAIDVDNNFWQAVQDIQAKAVQGVGIANFSVSGNQMTVVLTDHTLLGPYTLPVTEIKFYGEWVPNHFYAAGSIITHGGSTYFVNVNHTSAATFDPGANAGGPPDYYGLLLQNAALTLPLGGTPGQFLRKFGTTDYVSVWEFAFLSDLADVDLVPSPPPDEGSVLTYSGGFWIAGIPSATTLDGLTDVSIISPVVGQVISWDGSTWVNATPSGLASVAINSPVAGQLLEYDGTNWVNNSKADLPCAAQASASGSLYLDRANGEYQRFSITSNVTVSGFSNWPFVGRYGRLILEIINGGSFTWTWPSYVRWPGGVVPVVSTGRDIYVIHTFDGGSNIYGNVVGQNFL